MACPDSGPIKISDLVAEFGGSAPHALSEYYRDGGEVPGNNTNVPTSGQISLSQFYSAVNEIQHIISTNTNHFNVQTAFSSHWNTTVPKRVIINSGVTVGATSGNDAFHIPSGMAGTLVIDNNGNIHGHGGAGSSSGSGGSGGDAMQCDQSTGVTVNNNGQIYAGGGGGGRGGNGGSGGSGGSGGTGGNGQLSRKYYGPGRYQYINGYLTNGTNDCWFYAQPHTYAVWGWHSNQCYDSGCDAYWWCYENVYTNGGSGGSGGGGGNGGAGGAGGNGQGHNQSQANGSSGSGGSSGANPGNNAGQGGTGGTGGSGGQGGTGGNGGTFGNGGGSGATGSTGAGGNSGATGNNGNQTNGSGGSGGSSGSGGSGGSSGGSAGYYIKNRSYVTLNQNGNVAGQ